MICPHCGRYLEDGVAFCIYCGQRLGKYASGDAADSSQTANLSDNPLQAENTAAASQATASTAAHAATGAAAAGAAAATGVAAAPVAPASAQEGARASQPRPSVSGRNTRDGRLHSDDEIARRMDELGKEPNRGNGRKVLGGVILAALAAGAIGFGATQVVPSIMDGGNGGSSAVTTSSSSDSSSSSSKASSSSSKASKSSSTKSSKSTTSSNADTKRGSTLERANSDETTSTAADQAANETVAANPTTGEETTTGVVNTYTPAPAANAPSGFSGAVASATSISPTEGGVTHGPELVLDGVPETAWNTNENGVGQSITLSVDAASNVSGLRIMNGYNKISASTGNDLYWANARAKEIRIEYEGGGFDYTLEDLKGEYQTVNFGTTVNTTWVKITILSVYPGSMYDDCCISEIEVI